MLSSVNGVFCPTLSSPKVLKVSNKSRVSSSHHCDGVVMPMLAEKGVRREEKRLVALSIWS